MKTLLLAAAAASIALGAGGAYADNPNVPSNSPYAIMGPDGGYAPAYRMHRRIYRDYGYDEYGSRIYERRSAYRDPAYFRDTAPPPGFMFDQPSTIGGYPLGY